MKRSLLTRSPLLMSMFPFFDKKDSTSEKSVNVLLDDEMGWDRVKKIFCLNEENIFTKELQSIINVTVSGIVVGTFFGGTAATKSTVNNFIASNEASRYMNQFDAKRHLQQAVSTNFIRKGARYGGKLGLFCCVFSTITTCTTAYRGKMAFENYTFGGAVAGFLYKMNLGLRAALVGTGFGSILGTICGGISVAVLQLSGITIDEVLSAQQEWVNSRNQVMSDAIKESMNTELPELQQMYEKSLEAKKSLKAE